MKVLCVFGQHNYGNPARGEGYEYVNFIPALRRLGHTVAFFDSWNRSLYSDFADLNLALLKTVEAEKPDLIFAVLMHFEIWLETWEILRNVCGITTVNWATDDSWKYAQFSRLVAPAFDAFATTYRSAYQRYLVDGHRSAILTQWAANSETLNPPLPARECCYPVSFVGSAHGDRAAWVAELRRRGIEVHCFGHGWPAGPVAAAEIPRIMRSSVISLNFANSLRTRQGLRFEDVKQIKARTFEVPGAGGFLLTEAAQDLDLFYQDSKEIAVYQDLNDLEARIRHYLAHHDERDRIAQAGFERTRTEHTYELRFAPILDFAQRQHGLRSSGMPYGAQQQEAFVRFSALARSHRPSQGLQLLRHLLVRPASAVWGPVRGPRAARRLVFELSWRLAGAETYRASGWPGRMFYRES